MSSHILKSDLKIIVIGNPGTGKTSFVNKYTKNIFSNTYKPTVLSDFGFKIYEDDGKIYRIQIWDLAGQDNDNRIGKIVVKNTDGCIIMSDATNIETRKE